MIEVFSLKILPVNDACISCGQDGDKVLSCSEFNVLQQTMCGTTLAEAGYSVLCEGALPAGIRFSIKARLRIGLEIESAEFQLPTPPPNR